jgi:hypothetical protein
LEITKYKYVHKHQKTIQPTAGPRASAVNIWWPPLQPEQTPLHQNTSHPNSSAREQQQAKKCDVKNHGRTFDVMRDRLTRNRFGLLQADVAQFFELTQHIKNYHATLRITHTTQKPQPSNKKHNSDKKNTKTCRKFWLAWKKITQLAQQWWRTCCKCFLFWR